MRDHFFKTTLTRFPASFLLAAAIAALSGCSDNTSSAVATTNTPIATVPADIALGTSANWIPTDNSTAATLTATLVDTSNAVMPGVIVSFATNSGNLNASTATTDASGQATVTLKSGLADFSNRTATVTATVAGVASASVPVLIKGSTVALAVTPSNTIQVGTGTLAATATATNAAALGLSNQTIRFSIGATSTGAATLSAATLITDATGVTPTLTFTPTASGTVVLTAEWLDPAGAVTATATKDIFVTAATGLAFAITIPASDPFALTSGATQLLAATVPATIAGGTVANVRISATSGTWTGTSPATGPLTSIFQTPTSGAAAATYTAPGNSGSVTVQVDALDASGATLGTLTRTFVISAPATAAAKLLLSASASTVVPSSGGNISTLTLEAIVRDVGNNAVGGAAVMFGLLGTTGSGESVSPAVAITDSRGIATTTFSAGSAPTLAAIHAQARVVGQACTFVPDPLVAETNTRCDSTPLMVSSSAVSVTVGFGSTITDTANTTQYKLPGSVLVVNSNGSAVAGATVTLTVFPVEYRNGEIFAEQSQSSSTIGWDWGCEGPYTTGPLPWPGWATPPAYVYSSFTANEDSNRNGLLDAGEDTVGNGVIDTWAPNEDANLNGVLDFTTEDSNGNGFLDLGEDLNGNGIIDVVTNEDTNGNGVLDANTEDVNLNGILDPGEDTAISASARAALAIPGNNRISPEQAAGGTVPMTVTTDANGAATFYLQYPKSAAWFIKDEVTARVMVMGTESSAKTTLILPMSEPDSFDNNCTVGHTAIY